MDTYDEDNVPQDTAEPGDQPDTAKVSQQQAHYRRGSPVQHCGVCMHFIKPADDGNTGACTKVEGAISPYGLSDVYAEAANPFGPSLGPQERGMIDEMSQSGPDQSRFAQVAGQMPAPPNPTPDAAPTPPQYGIGSGGPAMRIGRQSY